MLLTLIINLLQVSVPFYWLKCMVLLLQSGKSAAIYACAKEEGFKVLEVLLILQY